MRLFFIIFFINTSIFSQKKTEYIKIKATYGIETVIDKTKESYKFLLIMRPELAKKREAISKELDFSLVFNDTTSVFYLEKKLFSDNGAASLAVLDAGYFGRIKQVRKHYITENLQEEFGKFLVVRPYQKWVISEETKKIDEYLCFKATTTFKTTNQKGQIFTRNVVAWYTPELPYKFGPAGYGNLPGLIIELQDDRATYGVKKIEFYQEQNKKNLMPKLTKKKLISEEEFEKLAAEDEKRWRSKRDKN